MDLQDIPFGTTDWNTLEVTERRGEAGIARSRTFRLVPGTSYQVADRAEAHRSSSAEGATLFIVD